jgi:hypothetical protein
MCMSFTCVGVFMRMRTCMCVRVLVRKTHGITDTQTHTHTETCACVYARDDRTRLPTCVQPISLRTRRRAAPP